jgi:hypothetical protein
MGFLEIAGSKSEKAHQQLLQVGALWGLLAC